MLKLQKFIEQNTNWEEILQQEPYRLTIKKEKALEGEYVLFQYHQFYSDFSLPIVQEARGIIFRMTNNDIIPVCVPFYKFFNLGEPNAAKLEGEIKFLEKRDGSLIKLWYDLGEWHWSTNGGINAENAKVTGIMNANNDEKLNFLYLIYKTKQFPYIQEMMNKNLLNTNLTYMFELTSDKVKIVVPYKGTCLTFLSARDNITLKEQDYNFGEYENNIPRPMIFKINDFSAAVNTVNGFSFKKEGLVAVDDNYNRVKIKSPAYLSVSYLRLNGEVTKNRIIELIRTGEKKEFLNYYPEYTEVFNQVEQEINVYKNMIHDVIVDLCINNITDGRQAYEKYKNKTSEERKIASAWLHQEFFTEWLYNFTSEQILEKIEKYTKEINK